MEHVDAPRFDSGLASVKCLVQEYIRLEGLVKFWNESEIEWSPEVKAMMARAAENTDELQDTIVHLIMRSSTFLQKNRNRDDLVELAHKVWGYDLVETWDSDEASKMRAMSYKNAAWFELIALLSFEIEDPDEFEYEAGH